MTKGMPMSRKSTGRRICNSRRMLEVVTAMMLLLGFAGIGRAQNQQIGQSYPRGQGQWGQIQPDQSYPGQMSGDSAMEEKRLNALNAERQKALIADTEKRVKLAAELNEEVNGKNLDQLTPDQLRKVAEIEKLAHNIREKMSTSVKPAPSMMNSPMGTPLIPNMH